ncbi:MAG TPA: malate synthase A [Thermoanaerobaculia bacterium]|nr:malate synthase A [Thermoanaerobaculia bacterium]
MTSQKIADLEFLAPIDDRFARILTPEACRFVAGLCRIFGPRRRELLAARAVRHRELDAGKLPDFLPETAHIRQASWQVPPPPADLLDRRTEITGPVDRKMVINALNSGAQCYMADFEDATSPTWENVIDGQINVYDAVRRTISFTSPDGKVYALNDNVATLIVRPRGWHLPEKHVLFEGEPISGSLLDWGLFFFHNAQELVARGSGPYFYLPKLESHLEARLWHQIFLHAEAELGLPRGTIRATVLIETILATFEAEEILYELGEHALGLNCGRWDYIFSCIKRLSRQGKLYPDRAQVTMTVPFMRAYALWVIRICHRHGAYAMGGMAAQIPIKSDPVANEAALAKVRADKEREAADGHDGTWVGHPGLVPTALEAFSRHLKGPNQLDRLREDVHVTQAELLAVPEGTITEAGVRVNLSVGVQYVESWIRGLGCVPLYHLMEDAATAEISRSQLWQWLHYGGALEDGRKLTAELYHRLLAEELAKLRHEVGAERYDRGRFPEASKLFLDMVEADELAEFLTLPAYELLP